MQDTVTWSPESIHVEVSWETKLYIFYLLFVIAISLIKAFQLLRQIGFLSFRKYNREITVDSLASAAFLNKLPREVSLSVDILNRAETRFEYLWEINSSKNKQFRKLAILNLLLGTVLLLLLAIKFLTEITVAKMFGVFFVAEIVQEVLAPFTLGIIVSSALYAFSIFYEGVLSRRRATWRYFSHTNF